jgi:hypothetical protein
MFESDTTSRRSVIAGFDMRYGFRLPAVTGVMTGS